MRKFLKPKEGLIIYKNGNVGSPEVKTEGEWLETTSYILRRIKEGSLVEVEPEEAIQSKSNETELQNTGDDK